MKKEEILARSRQEKADEGIEYAMNRGRSAGVRALSVMFLVLCAFNYWKGITNYAIFALYWSYRGFECYGRYQVTRQKGLLVTAVLGLLAGLLFLVCYLLQYTLFQ